MGNAENKRFQIGWLSVILMLGVAILVGYAGLGLLAAAGVFLLGIGLIMIALSFALGRKEPLITGAGALFAIIGAVLMLLYAGADLMLVLGGTLAGIALAAIVYVAAKK
ncbi:MAG: hypothetical protein O0X93_03295 [Methanocorpusculum sp.]|uniref:Uncharacterized protein n=1 Tax=Methanocorpusculum petauri TaxID=3002863 RepID=A0ABT4IFQ6_9EURY|nr:hypothetical protein [Methanocorpusculum petauri]MDE2443587.1 hypothetical protein [Methanocorpusculum sp.]MCZ0860560.1 hypothetical protein [Methanocorpusculum petauri]MDE2519356.1 hypothetical protein [Methanocorpusculum sp.]MDE2522172.1 hypothetical protein [Methanocorpusculum sp.]MDE2525317.1 hypothetical protein [Methanocorpusculum sp.]